MRHSHTSRGLTASAKTILGLVTLAFAGACSDSISAPTTEVTAKAPAGYSQVLGVKSFRYDPTKGVTQRLGNHVLVIPSGGICDLSSGHEVGHWDDACAPLTHAIIITATTFADNNGSPYIEFQPALRFVPSKETDLYLKDGIRTNGADVTINYCTLVSCVDESLTDASLVTHRIGNSRILVRRIKHFSGYNIGAGDCKGTLVPDPDGGMLCMNGSELGRSGYMLATGLTSTDDPRIVGRRKPTDQ